MIFPLSFMNHLIYNPVTMFSTQRLNAIKKSSQENRSGTSRNGFLILINNELICKQPGRTSGARSTCGDGTEILHFYFHKFSSYLL
ncbi:hypothetical protein UNH65_02810 [Chitinophaga sp. 180180018-2]|nr:hypothetical protein [Chitinophaga sp. 212800010-3]